MKMKQIVLKKSLEMKRRMNWAMKCMIRRNNRCWNFILKKYVLWFSSKKKKKRMGSGYYSIGDWIISAFTTVDHLDISTKR